MNQPIHPQGADFTVGDHGADVRAVMKMIAEGFPENPEFEEARAAVSELLGVAQQLRDRIAYYASLGEEGAPNIEDWAYTDRSGDIARLDASIRRCQGTPA